MKQRSIIGLYDDVMNEPHIRNDKLGGLYPNEYLRLMLALPTMLLNMLVVAVPEKAQALFNATSEAGWRLAMGGSRKIMSTAQHIRDRVRKSLSSDA